MNNLLRETSRLRCLLLGSALLAGASTAFGQVETASSTPTKIYASVGDAISFAVAYTGPEIATTDLVVNYTANTTSPVITPSAACISPATPSPYTSANPNEFYVLWDGASTSFPLNCGGSAAAAAFATFTGVATTIPGGSYVIVVHNNASNGAPNVTSNDVTVCQKPTVTSVTGPVAAPEGSVQQFVVNFTPTIAAGCEGVSIPATLSGPATAAPDSVAIFGTGCSNLPAAASSCTISVQGTDDAVFDGDKAMTLTVTNSTAGSNYVSSNQSASGTVQDNESGISVALGRNGAEGGNSVQFNVTCVRGNAGTAPAAATVNLAWAGAAPAAVGADFTTPLPASVPVVCTTGAGTATLIDLLVDDDALVEGTENLQVTISTSSANVAVSGSASATATVTDNDTPPVFGVTKAGACAEALVPTNCSFDIVRESGVAGPFTVNFTVTGGTRGTDYVLRDTTCAGADITTNSVSHTAPAPGGAFTIAVCVIDDLIQESGGETVVLSLAAAVPPGTYTLGATSSQSQNIADDDSPQVVTIAASGSPAELGNVPGTFTLTRSGGSAAAQAATLTVNVSTGGSAALGGACGGAVDYTRTGTASATTVAFGAGSPTAQVVITPCDDAVLDPAETATLTVAAPTVVTDYTVGTPPDNTASLTIIDDEVGVGVAAVQGSIIEGGTAQFTISCAGLDSAEVAFSFSGTYSPLPGSGLELLTCGTPIPVSVVTIDDATVNGSRTITLCLDSVTPQLPPDVNASRSGFKRVGAKVLVIDPAQMCATVTVVDNDQPRIIPTMNTLGLMLLGLLLAAAAGFGIRRKT